MPRNLSLDILRFVMAFLIIALHGDMFSDVNDFLYYFSNNGLFRMRIPVFLLISGYYFYRVTDTRKFLVWIKRLFILYVVWFFLYAYFWYTEYDGDIGVIVEVFFSGYSHLWYLTHALLAFVVLWFLRGKPKTLLALVVVCTLCGIYIQYARAYGFADIGEFSFGKLRYYRNAFFYCLPFIYIGYNINKYRLNRRWRNRPMLMPILMTIGLVLLAAEVCLNYMFSRAEFNILVSIFIVAPLLFIFALNKQVCHNSKSLAYYSTGIYLTHMIFILLPIRELLGWTATPYVFFVFASSILVTWPLILLNRKLKYIL